MNAAYETEVTILRWHLVMMKDERKHETRLLNETTNAIIYVLQISRKETANTELQPRSCMHDTPVTCIDHTSLHRNSLTSAH